MARASKTTEAKRTVEKKRPARFQWRVWAWGALAAAVCVSTAMGALRVRQFTLSDPQFQFRRENPEAFTISGLRYAAKSKVQRVFASDYGHSVFAIPLEERRRRLLAIDWVADASVLRIWPDRISVHIREREPVAFVLFRGGLPLLIDREGALLEPPAQAQFTFPVLSGVTPEDSDEQRRERVRVMLRVEDELGYIAKDISEINTADLDNIRVLTQVDQRAVELILGDSNFASRARNFLTNYPEIRKRSPDMKSFDLRLDDRITAKE
jgi:cell division protein FtsQ